MKTPTELAAETWMNHPICLQAITELGIKMAHLKLLQSLLYATFSEGARYATERCVDAGHGEKE